jgi:hypothetical protein
VVVNNKGLVTTGLNVGASAQQVSLSGDVRGLGLTGTSPIGVTLAAIPGLVAGTYNSVVVNPKGQVTQGTFVPMSGLLNLGGDVTASGTTGSGTIAVTLVSVGTAGTYNTVSVDSKGRVVGGSNVPPPSSSVTLSGDLTGSGVTGGTIAATLANIPGITAGATFARVVVDSKGRVTQGFTTNPVTGTVLIGGDVVASGTLGATMLATLATVPGLVAGTYNSVSVNTKGQVIGGANTPVASTVAFTGDLTGSGTTGTTIAVALANVAGPLVGSTLFSVQVDTKGRVIGGSGSLPPSSDTLQTITARGAASDRAIILTNTTASTSATTGALVLTGGMGLGGNLTTSATSTVNLGAATSPPSVRLFLNGSSASSVTNLNYSSTVQPNFATGNNFNIVLTGNMTLSFPSNPTVGQSGIIYLVQDGTGSRTVSYGTGWRFPGGAAPTLTTTANSVDALVYVVRTTSLISVVALLNI